MNKLHLLHNRVSVSKLQSPGPDESILVEVFKAASRAADHGMLRPWRYLVIEGDGLHQLSQLFVAAMMEVNPNTSLTVLEKCQKMPFRAPMIVVAIVKHHPHPTVSKQEQVLACGASVQNILNALFALGFGAIWRSGEMTQNPHVNAGLNVAEGEEIIGFIYVGTPVQAFESPPEADINAIFKTWPSK